MPTIRLGITRSDFDKVAEKTVRIIEHFSVCVKREDITSVTLTALLFYSVT